MKVKREDLIIRKSFAVSHHNGELWAVNLDALYDFEEVVQSKFSDDIKEIKRPSTPSAVAINLNETLVGKHLAQVLAEGLADAGGSVRKVAFVGLSREAAAMMKKAIQSRGGGFVYRFFDDFMKAKDWLV